MKLLVITQAVDQDDPLLGFFHAWIEELASRVESVQVICLFEGRHALPKNVRVHSLGKEGGRSRVKYVIRLFSYAWSLRKEYEAVFVHMNEEYVVIAGMLWRVLGKRISLWRNYPTGTVGTHIAALLAHRVFCTSKHSYTARFKKTELMPVGVDTQTFTPNQAISPAPHSVLFLARMSPAKRVEMLIDALALLAADRLNFTATFVGSPPPDQQAYYEHLTECVVEKGLSDRVRFLPAVANSDTVDLYRAHEVFVNTSPSGMFDKTLFEAAACGAKVLAASKDFAELAGKDAYFDASESLAARLRTAFNTASSGVPSYVAEHSLTRLGERLVPRL
jgi:glycosyltransferase involved in cell wall biosynthesis